MVRQAHHKMITVDLFGGLGNQMFQYALGRHLALKNEVPLTLRFVDVRAFSKRGYELGCFKLSPGVRVDKGSSPFKFALVAKVRHVLDKLPLRFGSEVVFREKGFTFDPLVLALAAKDIHLTGFWQSEKYFKDIREKILEDFTFVRPLSPRNRRILREIKKSNSVSVHVRRGDYVIDPETRRFHGICSPDYYRRAMEIIAKKVSHPVFYFFWSDDKDWVRKNLKTRFRSVYVDWNRGEDGFVDMQLMSNCKHNILANSSFSWWGAWLNRNSDKIAIAPKNWFQDPSVDTQDLVLEGWVKI